MTRKLSALRVFVVVVASMPSALRASYAVARETECFNCIVRELQLQNLVDVKSLAKLSQSEIAEIILDNLLCDRCWPIKKQDLRRIYGCMPWVSLVQNDCNFILQKTINDSGRHLMRMLTCLNDVMSREALSCILAMSNKHKDRPKKLDSHDDSYDESDLYTTLRTGIFHHEESDAPMGWRTIQGEWFQKLRANSAP
ncbi:hypothetical protein MRX96_056263 [Rhipicephalus microplus]